jgi:hypothetical protein
MNNGMLLDEINVTVTSSTILMKNFLILHVYTLWKGETPLIHHFLSGLRLLFQVKSLRRSLTKVRDAWIWIFSSTY